MVDFARPCGCRKGVHRGESGISQCYAGIAEFSVYVAREQRGRGFGELAMTTLIEVARQAGSWKLVSHVFIENLASRSLLREVGSREVGIDSATRGSARPEQDVVIVERLLLGE